MVGSRITDHDRLVDGGKGGFPAPPASGVSCSICLDIVSDNGGRSWAKLQCGHEFHLDCIGSAFNVKGAMQCPNCRKVERGQWLYANGCTRSFPEFSMDDWYPDEDYYDFYSEMPFRFHWCPFGELTTIHSAFEEVESPSTTYHELQGHRAIFSEHSTSSPVAGSYVAYVGPLPPTSLRASDGVDDLNFNHHWNNLSGRNEIFAPHAFPAINIHYHSWGSHSPTISISGSHVQSVDPASIPPGPLRTSQGELDATTRLRSFPHPLPFEHGSNSRAGSSFVSAIIPRHPGSSERIQVSHSLHHQQQPTNQPGLPTPLVPAARRGLPTLVPTLSPPNHHNGGLYIFPPSSSSGQGPLEAESPLPSHFHAWEQRHLSHFSITSRGSGWGLYHSTGPSDSSNLSGSFRHRPFS
ncbi:hypothetical protein SLE2022_243470 [Rubroshorea leprosula]